MPKEVEQAHCKHLESRLDKLNLAITSLTKGLVGKGTRIDIECKEELVHNSQTISWNAVVLVA